MNQEQVLTWAREAGFSVGLNDPIIYAAHERFAALVAAHEREACTKEAEVLAAKEYNGGQQRMPVYYALKDCAAAIRARSK